MATVTVNPGICGLTTIISSQSDDMQNVSIEIQSHCPHIKSLGNELKEVDGYEECFAKIGEGQIYKMAGKHCKHTACPVPSAVIKAVEVACGLALPKDVEFKIEK